MFASYVSRGQSKPRLVFSRINGPIMSSGFKRLRVCKSNSQIINARNLQHQQPTELLSRSSTLYGNSDSVHRLSFLFTQVWVRERGDLKKISKKIKDNKLKQSDYDYTLF